MGRLSLCQALMRFSSISTTVTSQSGHFAAIMAIVGPPTYPAPMQRIFVFGLVALIIHIPSGKVSFLIRQSRKFKVQDAKSKVQSFYTQTTRLIW
jgi:hypothetical protein